MIVSDMAQCSVRRSSEASWSLKCPLTASNHSCTGSAGSILSEHETLQYHDCVRSDQEHQRTACERVWAPAISYMQEAPQSVQHLTYFQPRAGRQPGSRLKLSESIRRPRATRCGVRSEKPPCAWGATQGATLGELEIRGRGPPATADVRVESEARPGAVSVTVSLSLRSQWKLLTLRLAVREAVTSLHARLPGPE
jgi:hypothetical protein